MKNESVTIIGAPTSAGAYSPGQEAAPDALRNAGLIKFLEANHIGVNDLGNVRGFRWRADKENPRAMNSSQVAEVATALSQKVYGSLNDDRKLLVLGGDCTIELGAVAGVLKKSDSIGLIYIDLDTDLNTPQSVDDGALDWMGVAHLLNIPGCEQRVASIGRKVPMLDPSQVYFYANGNMTEFEKELIRKHKIRETPVHDVAADPRSTARHVCETWASQFEHVLIHLDTDVLDFFDMPLAENYRRNVGLKFEQLMTALREFLGLPNWSVLTITEINPFHGEKDGSTLKTFAEDLAKAIAYKGTPAVQERH